MAVTFTFLFSACSFSKFSLKYGLVWLGQGQGVGLAY